MPIASLLLQRPENRVLQLCACGPHLRPNFAPTLAKVSDWEYLVSHIHIHRLSLLFLHHVKGHEHLVPADVLVDLQETGEQILHWNLFLLTELQYVTRLLTEGGVRVLSYKGPTIALSAYGTMALRRFVDLDLLVSPRDRTRAFSLLKASGYHSTPRETALSPYLERIKATTVYEKPFLSADDETLLDIHWDLVARFESFPVGFESLWARRVPVTSIPGVSTFCREDLALSLCFHGLKHGWEKLEWIGCLLNVLRNDTSNALNWSLLEARCRFTGTERILYVGLRLALDLLESDATCERDASQAELGLPINLVRRVESDSAVQRIAALVWKRNFPLSSNPRHERWTTLEDHVVRLASGVLVRRGQTARWKFLVGMTQVGLLSWENSRLALKMAGPLLRFMSASGDGTQARPS